jgi:NAD(P)H dehydrogenase (quinone)
VPILVTGATGRTGQRIVDHLLAGGQQVRILTRATSSVPDRWNGVERATGDLDDAESLQRAMSGVEGLFVLSPMDPSLDRLEGNAFDAAVRVGVNHVIKMSTTKPEPDSPIPWWQAHWRSEQALRRSGLPWTILRPNGISFFLLEHARGVRENGVLRTAAGNGRMALIDADDIGAVTASVFADPGRHTGDVLDLTGPAAVTYGDVADILTSVTGRRVIHVDISPEEGRALVLSYGRPAWEAEGLVANWLMTRDGSGGFDRVTDQVERISGRSPLSLEVFLATQREAFAPAL